jgi:hypothetical protein
MNSEIIRQFFEILENNILKSLNEEKLVRRIKLIIDNSKDLNITIKAISFELRKIIEKYTSLNQYIKKEEKNKNNKNYNTNFKSDKRNNNKISLEESKENLQNNFFNMMEDEKEEVNYFENLSDNNIDNNIDSDNEQENEQNNNSFFDKISNKNYNINDIEDNLLNNKEDNISNDDNNSDKNEGINKEAYENFLKTEQKTFFDLEEKNKSPITIEQMDITKDERKSFDSILDKLNMKKSFYKIMQIREKFILKSKFTFIRGKKGDHLIIPDETGKYYEYFFQKTYKGVYMLKCEDYKRCQGYAKVKTSNCKFSIIRKHTLPYEEHTYNKRRK